MKYKTHYDTLKYTPEFVEWYIARQTELFMRLQENDDNAPQNCYAQPMKRLIAIALLAILVGGLVGLAIYEYQNRPKPVVAATYSQRQYNSVVSTMQTHDAINKAKADQLAAQVQAGDAKLLSVCTQLKSVKQTNVNCQ